MTFDSRTLTHERYEKRTARTIAAMGYGATDGALAIIETYLNDTHKEIVETLNDNSKTPKDILNIIIDIDTHVLSLAGLQTTLGCVAACDSLAKTLRSLGIAVESEAYAVGLEKYDGKVSARIVKKARERHGSMKYRRKAVRSNAAKAGFKFSGWTDTERLKVGSWLLDRVLTTDAFVLASSDEHGAYVALTEDALAVSDRMVRVLMERRPILLPSLDVPEPWTAPKRTVDGFEVSLVRKYDRVTQGTIRTAIESGQLGMVLEAVNAAQRVSYRVNGPILEAVRWCYENGLAVDGLPPVDDLPSPQPDKPWDEMDDAEKRIHRKRLSDTKDLNRSFVSQRLMLERDLATADYVGGRPFWTILNLDYRGRLYGLPSFNFQRQDYVRGLFRFADGKALGSSGLYWLGVHLANCGDFGKVSKQPFASRIAWVVQNLGRIVSVADDWQTDLWWTEADKPFLFLAACMDYVAAIRSPVPYEYESALPCSWDGSCSGLQHLCAMTRAEEGLLVNLGPTEQPNDVYQVVADLASQRVRMDLDDPKVGFLAERALAYGVNRSLVKRNVMTYSYSSKKFGMAQQQLEDTMKPLEYRVLSGELSEHPFGADNGYSASRYLASVIYDGIESVVSKPAEAMRFLQGIARTLAHEGKPMVWTTPLGFPVVLRYTEMTTKRVGLFLHNRGVRVQVTPRTASDTKVIDKTRMANAVAPSFVHSLDACHLQMVCLAATKEGMSLALVHDSFGSHAADACRFREIIKDEFVKLYQTDVLKRVYDECHAQVSTNHHRLPKMPSHGTLDINTVMNADYAFA